MVCPSWKIFVSERMINFSLSSSPLTCFASLLAHSKLHSLEPNRTGAKSEWRRYFYLNPGLFCLQWTERGYIFCWKLRAKNNSSHPRLIFLLSEFGVGWLKPRNEREREKREQKVEIRCFFSTVFEIFEFFVQKRGSAKKSWLPLKANIFQKISMKRNFCVHFLCR